MPPKRYRENMTPNYTPSSPPTQPINSEGAPVFFAPSSHISVNHGFSEEIQKNMLDVLKSIEDGITFLKKKLEKLEIDIGVRLNKIETRSEDFYDKTDKDLDANQENIKDLFNRIFQMDEILNGIKDTVGVIDTNVEELHDEATLKSYLGKK